jgi:hypothetical protein
VREVLDNRASPIARAKMRGFMLQALQLVYDNYSFFVIGYGRSEKAADAIFSLAARAKGLSLCSHSKFERRCTAFHPPVVHKQTENQRGDGDEHT